MNDNLNILNYKSMRFALTSNKLTYHWHINMKQFEIDLENLSKSALSVKKCDLITAVFEVVFNAATTAGINTFDYDPNHSNYFFDAAEISNCWLFFKRLMIKHALRSHCILTSLSAIIHTPPCSQKTLTFRPTYAPLYYSGAFVLNTILKKAQDKTNAKGSALAGICYDLLKINKCDEPTSKIPNIARHRFDVYKNTGTPSRIFIRKNTAEQLADISTSTFRLPTADAYWMCFLLHNNLSAISHYEHSLYKFLNKQENYPAQIIGILKDLTSIERSFRDILPDEMLKQKKLNFIEQLEEYTSCDYLLNYMRLEQTFRIQYYIDILVILDNKNPEKIYSNPAVLDRKDTYKCSIRQLEEIPNTHLLKLFSYLDTMPNVFSRALFLSYAFDCYYLLENYDQNYADKAAVPSAIRNMEKPLHNPTSQSTADLSNLIFKFLIYVNKELLPVLTELWQAACDYLDCRLSNDDPETCDEFTKILITYASRYKHDLTLDFAALSAQNLNTLAAEFDDSLKNNIYDYNEAWVLFENTMLPKISKILMKSDNASDKTKKLSSIKESINGNYSDIKDVYSKDDLQKIEMLIKKTQKMNGYEVRHNQGENSFSDILNLQNNLCRNDDFYDAIHTFGITPANAYRAESHYCLSNYYSKSEEAEFESKFYNPEA